MATPIVYNVAPLDAASQHVVFGYAKNNNEILLASRDSSITRFYRISSNTFLVDDFHVDSNSPSGNHIFNQSPLGASCDRDGYWYGVLGGNNNTMAKYDNVSPYTLLKTSSIPGTAGIQQFIKVVTDSIDVQHVAVINDNSPAVIELFSIDNTSPGGVSDFVRQGKANVNAAGNGIDVNSFQALYDKNGMFWALTSHISGGTNDSQLVMIDPNGGVTGDDFNVVSHYTVSGAVFGQPIAMWYVASDHSFVMQTNSGFLIKWDIGTTSIIANVDQSATLGTWITPGIKIVSSWAKNSGQDTQIVANSQFSAHIVNPISMAITTTYNLRTILGDTGFGLNTPLSYFTDIQTMVFPYGPDWTFVKLAKNHSRMIFINT